MKYIARILGLLLIWGNTALARPTIADIEYENDDNKTVFDAMIEVYYNHPEIIYEMEEKCKDVEKFAGVFKTMPAISFVSTECIAWDTNKKLNKKQIDALTKLNKTWEYVILDLIQGDDFRDSFASTFDDANEYSLQLAVRIHNLIMKQNWPECPYETGEKDISPYVEPCNEPSEVMTVCEKATDMQSCMQNEILQRLAKFQTVTSKWTTKEETEKKRDNDTKLLIQLTKDFIATIISDKNEQNKEILRLYNFYWISMYRSYINALNYAYLD